MVQKGMPYLIVPENDMHNINIIIDERGSLSVSSPVPGRLASLLKSINKVGPFSISSNATQFAAWLLDCLL
uniref:Uncharacterized protein n=1 Tax=Aegilops tauschii subsp. strangulata TaxID=200361 RepID=A0A453IDW8_AEGTS